MTKTIQAKISFSAVQNYIVKENLLKRIFFHKIQHLMIEAGRHGHKKKIVWGKHPEILFWALRGYLRSGDDFIDHLSYRRTVQARQNRGRRTCFQFSRYVPSYILVGVHCKDIPQHIQ